MAEIIEIIRKVAHKAAEGYLVKGASMDATILSELDEDSNSEIVRRISELANQNVYLSLYSNPKVNKGTISFDMANADNIISELQKSESAMEDYSIAPGDFRHGLDVAVAAPSVSEPADDVLDGVEKVATIHEIVDTREVFEKALAQVETMKFAEFRAMESAFNEMEKDAKSMVFNGDSIGDIAKIAMLSVDADDSVRMKIAQVYDEIANDMRRSGFKVNDEITKVSSLAINHNSPLVRPAKEFALSLQKYSAFNEMAENLKAMTSLYGECAKELS